MSDLSFTIGGDDAAFRQVLKNSETAASRSASRIGQIMQQQAQGYKRVLEAVRSPIAMGAGVLGTVALLAGAFEKFYGAAARADMTISKTRENLRQSALSVRALTDSLDRIRNGDTLDPLSGLRSGLAAAFDLQQKLRQQIKEVRYEQFANSGIQGLFRDMTDLGIGDDGLTTIQRRNHAREQEIELTEQLRKVEERVRDLGIDRARVLERTFDQMRRSAGVDLLDAQGATNEAKELRERQQHQERMERLRELTSIDQRRGQMLEATERQRHAFAMRRLREEREAAEKTKRQEDQRKRDEAVRQQMDYRHQLAGLEVESLRLTNQNDQAKMMERRIEHERNLADIARREGITPEQRRRLLESERMNYQMRLNFDSGEAARNMPQPRTVSGFFGAGAVARRILGPEQSQMGQLTTGVQQVVALVRQVERAISRGGSVVLEVID
jgi:hypothetical protein